jgi:hypothetical protein
MIVKRGQKGMEPPSRPALIEEQFPMQFMIFVTGYVLIRFL